MKKTKKTPVILFFIFCLLLSITTLISFSSNIDEQEIVIKSMTPVYDEMSGVVVDQSGVIFNDKNQAVKYNVVLENTKDYDVKISDIKLSTPTEEFLQYKIEGISTEDEIKANSTKELTISFETMGIKGWGRNFADELTANISFEKVAKQEEVVPPVEEDKEEDKQPEAPATNTEELISKAEKIEIIRVTKDTIEFKENNKLEKGDKLAVWLYSEPKFLGYFDVVEKDGIKQIVGLEEALKKVELEVGEHNIVLVTEEQETLGYVNIYIDEDKGLLIEKPQDTTDKEETPKEEDKIPTENKPSTDNKDESVKEEENKVENPYTSDKKLVGILGIATCITGVAIIIVSKNKFAKYTVFILMLSPAFTITNAEEVIEVAIKNNVSFESQNVMSAVHVIPGAEPEPEPEPEPAPMSNYAHEEKKTEENQPNMIPLVSSKLDNYEDEYGIDQLLDYRGSIKNIYIKNEITEIDEYVYVFDVTEEQNGRVKAYIVINKEESWCYDLYLQADGIIYPNENASYYFSYMENLVDIDNIEGLDTSNVTDMSGMFYDTGYNNTDFTLDLGDKFDTSNVTDMSYMFEGTGYSSTYFTLDLGDKFDTSNVTDMSYMFAYTGFSSTEFTLDVSNFDTSNVTNMRSMFVCTGYSSTEFTLDVSNFDTSNVTDMSYMFGGTGANSENFTLDLGDKFDTSKVTDMSNMFGETGVNSKNFTLDLGDKFDTSKVTDMSNMFDFTGASSENFTLNLGDKFDTSNVTDMSYMFACTGYSSTEFTLDVSNFDTSNVTDMSYMFGGTGYNSTKLNISITIKNPNVTNYQGMFESVATQPGSKIKVNYRSETSELVDEMIATKSSDSNVVKGNLIIDVDNLSIGDEIHISGEKFNVISQTEDTITMLAQYNLGTDYRQSSSQNSVRFANTNGWEYTPGPKEIDIQTWSTNLKTYVNAYVEYLKEELNDDNVTGDLITLKDLEALGCTVPSDYAWDSGEWDCYNSPYGWIANGQKWWTRSANSTSSYDVLNVYNDGKLNDDYCIDSSGVRPVITLSKETLKGL